MSPEGQALLDVTQEELDEEFDRTARHYLGMTGEEFVALVREGQALPRHPMTAHLLLMLGAGTGTNVVGN